MQAIIKHLAIRVAVILLLPVLFVVFLNLIWGSDPRVDIGLFVLALLAGYFVLSIAFLVDEVVRLHRIKKKLLRNASAGLLIFMIGFTLLFLFYA